MARAGFETAWELTTGGTTADGRKIVTAILDAGFDVTHEDLTESLWTNSREIPDDGLDNDGNGFIDDLHGWNFIGDSPAYPIVTHGTQVAGLIGATGNNARGVTGTNWSSRLMLFSINTVADIVAAYQYILEQRRLYNTTDGNAGALVVVTNASFGIEGGTCVDFPVWGAMYDALGEVGILTAASVANVSRDVDVVGDMPTDCPSEFLMGVTNVDQDDNRFSSAGFGRENVDLGAPGEGSYTTRPGNAYGSFGSTSAAAPYVTGAVALLYATPCPVLQELLQRDPSGAALLIRESLLASVRASPSLQNAVSTGGVLDVGRAQQYLLRACSGPGSASPAASLFPNPFRGRLLLRVPAPGVTAAAVVNVYNALGQRVLQVVPDDSRGRGTDIPLDLSEQPRGVYYVILTDGGQKMVLPCLRL